MKLGKLPAKNDPRTLKLADYVHTVNLPIPPVAHDWGQDVADWGMMVNDQLGDCTCAAVGHMILMDTTLFKKPYRPSDAHIVEMYHNVAGYIPGRPDTDNGAVELDVLNYWRKNGLDGHKIKAFAKVSTKDVELLKTAIFLFGGLYAGVAMPLTAEKQDIWDITKNGTKGPGSPGSWGGHAIPLVGYTGDTFTCVTWGQAKFMTHDWWLAYGDEAYAVISDDWVAPKGVAPSNFNMDQLMIDLNEVTKPKGE